MLKFVWQKLVKYWQAPTFCRLLYFVAFHHGGPVQTGWYSAGESPHIKAGQPAATGQSIGDCMRWRQHLQEENTREIREKPATANFSGPKQ
jgi:hypothetical protein